MVNLPVPRFLLRGRSRDGALDGGVAGRRLGGRRKSSPENFSDNGKVF